MYKCIDCENTENFQVTEHEITCMDCGALYSEGMIECIQSELSPLATKIMIAICEYHAHGGDAETVLEKIEQIILENE